MPKVSIVIPVYNVAKYLQECLDSLLKQTFTDWEAICVDDGSTDGSSEILDGYKEKDSRFIVIHQENGGVSNARQTGLSVSRGEYLGFVDPDDWIEKEMYANFVSEAERSKADYLWMRFSSSSARGVGKKPVQVYDNCLQMINSLLEGKLLASLPVRLFRMDFIKKNRICFLPGRVNVCEDLCFIIEVLSKNPKFVFVDKVGYHYRDVETSITHSMGPVTVESWRVVCKRLSEVLAGTSSEPSLQCFKRGRRVDVFLLSWLSDKEFYAFLPEEKTAKGVCLPFLRRCLFYLSVWGLRREVMWVASIVRIIKRKIGLRTDI